MDMLEWAENIMRDFENLQTDTPEIKERRLSDVSAQAKAWREMYNGPPSPVTKYKEGNVRG